MNPRVICLNDTVGWHSPLLRDMRGRVAGFRNRHTVLVVWEYSPGITTPPVDYVARHELRVIKHTESSERRAHA